MKSSGEVCEKHSPDRTTKGDLVGYERDDPGLLFYILWCLLG